MEICNKLLAKWIGALNSLWFEDVCWGSNNFSIGSKEICLWISVQDIQWTEEITEKREHRHLKNIEYFMGKAKKEPPKW